MENAKKNTDVLSEVRVVLVADSEEFKAERMVIHEVAYPLLKKCFSEEYNIEINLIDPYYNHFCNNVPNIDKSLCLTNQIEESFEISSGLTTLVLVGDSAGAVHAPRYLTETQFTEILNVLQKRKDPSWIIYNSKYTKDDKNSKYILDLNISEEENIAVVNSIFTALEDTNSKAFPDDIVQNALQSDLYKALHWKNNNEASKIRIIQRTLTEANPVAENYTLHQKKCKELYEMRLKEIKRKHSEMIESFSIKESTITEANKMTPNELLSLCSAEHLIGGKKSRSLIKDIRRSTTVKIYLEIFIEHITKLVMDAFLKSFQNKSNILYTQFEKGYHSNLSIVNANLETILSEQIDNERKSELTILDNYLSNKNINSPGLIYGTVGAGKTNLINTLVKNLKDSKSLIIVRRCGKTVTSSSLQLILSSITLQINQHFNKNDSNNQQNPQSHIDYATSVYNFWNSLAKAEAGINIIILLDDVDTLYPTSHTDLLKWLPYSLPMYSKVILTASSDTFYSGFKCRYSETNIISIAMLDAMAVANNYPKLLNTVEARNIPDKVYEQAIYCIQQNSKPLYIKLLSLSLDSVTDPTNITTDIKEVAKLYIIKLEKTYNPILIKHSLSFLALSRFGLSLTELVDLMSLDNKCLELLEFNININCSFRFPQYVVADTLAKMNDIIEYKQFQGQLLYEFKHKIFKTVIIEYYKLLQEEAKCFYLNILNYWTSKYEKGKVKSVFENDNNEDEDYTGVNSNSSLYVKRMISPQHCYILNKLYNPVSNRRKITELTHLLVQYSRYNDIYKLVLFNYDYLFAMIDAYDLSHLISEIYYSRSLNEIKNNDEVELLLAQLRVLPIDVLNDARLLAPELSGRLSHFVGQLTLITFLHQQIDQKSPISNVLIPALTCFPTVDLENFQIELGELNKLMFALLSTGNRSLVTIHVEIKSSCYILTVWDTKRITKSQIVNIGTYSDTKFYEMFNMPQRDDYILIKFEDLNNTGFLVINLELSSVENVIKLPKKANIKIEFLSKNHLYLKINEEYRVLKFPECQKDHLFSRYPIPTVYTSNDRYLIGHKLPNKKDAAVNKMNFSLYVMNGGSGENVAQLRLQYNAHFMRTNPRNEYLFVATKTFGMIYRYDLGPIGKENKKIKHNLELKLQTQANIISHEHYQIIEKYMPNIRGDNLIISTNERYLLVDYNVGGSVRFLGVWKIDDKSLIVFQQLDWSTYANFSTDTEYVYTLTKEGVLNVYSLLTGSSSLGKHYKFQFSNNPVQIFMLNSSNVVIVQQNSILLTTLKIMIQEQIKQTSATGENGQRWQIAPEPASYCCSVPAAKVNSYKGLVFSNDLSTSDFIFYQLNSNSWSQEDLAHGNSSLTDFPIDRFLSPDGQNLLLIYGFKPSFQRTHESEFNLDNVILSSSDNGQSMTSYLDYRKPQIPGENYFLGPINSEKNSFRKAYSQSILKIINLKTMISILQISLVGEQILNFMNDLLLTFKPNYASTDRFSDGVYDIISIYSLTDSKYVSSIYLEHPVVQSTVLPNDPTKLVVCCGWQGKYMKMLDGDYFSNTCYQIDIQAMLKYMDELARTPSVTGLFVFRELESCILVQYSWLEYNSNSIKVEKDTYYANIDVVKKQIISQFHTSGKIRDVTADGCQAVDTLLNVYDLSKGTVLRKLQDMGQSSIGKPNSPPLTNCDCKFSLDLTGNYVIVYDSDHNQLLVIKNEDKFRQVGRSLMKPVNKSAGVKMEYKMCLGSNGRYLIMYNDWEFKIFCIKLPVSSKKTVAEVSYKSSKDRIHKLLFI